ncbi:hypothetical protein C8R44DRAFT_361021 [Mycena epipterygia]|nr:hypothetical protein C8R44DRAFT_361021 [Mycena epipterygia]
MENPNIAPILSSGSEPSAFSLPVGRMFENATRFGIEGSQFTTVAGDVNIHQTPPFLAPTQTQSAPIMDSTVAEVHPDSHVYCSHLQWKGRGFPLYDPQPQPNLPEEYRRRGISIGDVGSVTPEGIFDFYFNVYLPSDHPINENLVPDNFVQLPLYAGRDTIHQDHHPGEHCSTVSVREIGHGFLSGQFPAQEFRFNCVGPSGTVLALPHGSHFEKLKNLDSLRRYAAEHADNWYRYINGVRGRELENGSLYLITGCEKSQSWGIASFQHVADEFSLAFELTTDGDDAAPVLQHCWQRGTPAFTKNSAPMRSNGIRPRNQTTFIQGFKIALGLGIWARIFGQSEVSEFVDFGSNSGNNSGGFVPYSSQNSQFSWTLGIFRGSSSTSGQKRQGDTILQDISPSEIFHPSQLILGYLLNKAPQAAVLIAHDDDWSDILDHDGPAPNSDQVEHEIAERFSLTEENGAVFLGPNARHEEERVLEHTSSVVVNALHAVNRHEDAVHANEEAVRVYRKLAEMDPTVSKDLANSLYKLGTDLSILGRHEDALGIKEKVVGLRRKHVETDPTAKQGLADSLQILAVDLRAVGGHEDALRADEEAVGLYRTFTDDRRFIVENFANTLRSFARDLSTANRHEEALQVDEEAVGLYRKLGDPAFTKDLAVSLVNLGVDLSAVGRHEDALHADEEAVKLHRKLAATDPTVTKNLAQSLHNLSRDLRAVKRHRDAARADEEAVELRRKLVETDATVSKDLAQSLHNLGIDLSVVNRREDALRADEKAVKLRRKLAATDPSVTKDLAYSLDNLAHDFRAVNRHGDAARADEEAVKIRRKLAKTDSTVTKDLAWSLYALGIDQRAVGRYEDALHIDEEAVELRRKLAETDPDISSNLADSLQNLGFDLSAVDRHEDAVRVNEEAVELYQKIAEPTVTLQAYLGNSLKILATSLHALGRHDDALLAHEKGDQIHRKLAEQDLASTADVVHDLALDFRQIGRRDDALRAEERAVELYRKLVQTEPAHKKDLCEALELLSGDLRAVGREEEAAHIDAEVIELEDPVSEGPSLVQVADLAQSLYAVLESSPTEPATASWQEAGDERTRKLKELKMGAHRKFFGTQDVKFGTHLAYK